MFNRRNFLSFLGVSPFFGFGKSKKEEVINNEIVHLKDGQIYRVKYSDGNGVQIYYRQIQQKKSLLHRIDGPAIIIRSRSHTNWYWYENNILIKHLEYYAELDSFQFIKYDKDEHKLVNYSRKTGCAEIQVCQAGWTKHQDKLRHVDYRWFEKEIGCTFDQLRDFQV